MKKFKSLVLAIITILIFHAAAHAESYTVGGGIVSFPDYEGSEDYRVLPGITFNGQFDNGISVDLIGLKLKADLIPYREFSLGPVINVNMGRKDVENDTVDRMNDIDGSLEAGVTAGYSYKNAKAELEFLADTGDSYEGYTAMLSISNRFTVTPKVMIIPSLFATYADENYMEAFFGVDASNVGTSGFDYYNADAGIKDVGLNLAVIHKLNKNWGMTVLGGYKKLIGDAADSPIVEYEGTTHQKMGGLIITYTFGK